LYGYLGHDRNASGRIERPVAWSNHEEQLRFVFTGGIIMTGNREFPCRQEVYAIKTRIAYGG